jgi:hypothetical protein
MADCPRIFEVGVGGPSLAIRGRKGGPRIRKAQGARTLPSGSYLSGSPGADVGELEPEELSHEAQQCD